jgi:iron complex transport system permease protein
MTGFAGRATARLSRRRLALIVIASAVACAVIGVVAPMIGVAPDRSGWHLDLIGPSALDPTSLDHGILMVRLPRVLAAMLTGAALAGAGCALQALLRNPLAEPFTLGISSGASLGAVLAIRFGLERVLGEGGVGFGALAGAVATLLAIWRLAQVGRQLPPVTLILAGVAISMFCGAATVLVQYTSDFADVEHMLGWMIGGLEAVPIRWVGLAAPPILGGLAVLVLYGKEMNALAAGSDAAASVGVAVARTQLVLFGVSSLLVGSAIAVVGPIGFIGLVVPHALRSLIGADHRALVVTSAFGGAIVLAICDTLARTIIPGNHLPTGAVTPVLGVPFFFAILLSNKRAAI